jgi:hypothetical protein
MAVLEDTNFYRAESFGNGLYVILTRHDDGATLLLQGDDANAFMCEWDAISNLINPDHLADRFDQVVSEYDHVFLERD